MAGRTLICGPDEGNQEVFDCVEELRTKFTISNCFSRGLRTGKGRKKVDSHPALPQRDSMEGRQTSI